jgi:hypothetical protein
MEMTRDRFTVQIVQAEGEAWARRVTVEFPTTQEAAAFLAALGIEREADTEGHGLRSSAIGLGVVTLLVAGAGSAGANSASRISLEPRQDDPVQDVRAEAPETPRIVELTRSTEPELPDTTTTRAAVDAALSARLPDTTTTRAAVDAALSTELPDTATD